jgi:hypothetical protein
MPSTAVPYLEVSPFVDSGAPTILIASTRKWLRRAAHRSCLLLSGFLLLLAASVFSAPGASAQEPPYFVAYSHALEEPDNLEIALKTTAASPKNGNRFGSATLELEYGAKAWWTTELYLSGQTTANDSTLFNGFRWENRFRPLMHEHWINPVLYFEFENVNEADRSFLEVMDHDSISDILVPNGVARQETERAMEMKLILSSNYKGWNISENFITEKALNESEPWEFGYALGVSRPLALVASSKQCIFCRENFAAGAELFGGLGTTESFGWKGTSQYLGPILSFSIPKGPTVSFSQDFGLNDNSVGMIYRVKVSYEIQQLFGRFHRSAQ